MWNLYSDQESDFYDVELAMDFLCEAAQHEHVAACYELGILFMYGRLVDKDEYEAAEWLEKAMEGSLRALMYDAASSEAYAAMGYVYYVRGQKDDGLISLNMVDDGAT